MLQKIFLTSLSLSLLASCTKPVTEVVSQPVIVKKDIPIIKRPSKVELNDVEFFVVTKDNYDEFIETFGQKNKELTFIAVSVKDYENLSLNLAELRRFIEQQNEIIVYYERAVTK